MINSMRYDDDKGGSYVSEDKYAGSVSNSN